MFALARALLADCSRVAVVGDNLVADIAGAKRAGLEVILVLSGATVADDIDRADVQPDMVLPSLAALTTP
ncbi:MAG: HAD hydrolase-like protein [Actinobacteria bacterium]|nr:HAD hydrolase-like protein [Actinomycetota bacterium]